MAILRWYLTVLLMCIYLMTRGIAHLIMSLVAFCVSSLGKCLFRPFDHFLVELVVFFFLISCMNSLCILDIKLLPDTWFAIISSHSVRKGNLKYFLKSFYMPGSHEGTENRAGKKTKSLPLWELNSRTSTMSVPSSQIWLPISAA